MPALKSANLCWGQRYHWLRYQHAPSGMRHEAHIVDNYPLPDGVSLGHIQAVLNHLVRRHEVLRTVYDPGASPWPRQRVEAPGPVRIAVATAEQDGTPAPAEVIRRVTTDDFDMSREWPIRAAVVTAGGAVTRLVLVFNHVAWDDRSLDTLRFEFDALLTAAVTRRPASLPPVALQPVDLAGYEASRAEPDEALGHWRDEISQLPADVFARRRDPKPRVTAGLAPAAAYSASLTSPQLLDIARHIAERRRIWPSAVHLAAYAVAMAAYTGEETVAHRLYTSQREASGHPSVMTCMSSPALIRVDLSDDPPFSEVLRRAAIRVEQALAHAHAPYDEIVELAAREGARRGQPVRVASEMNFLSNAPRSCRTRRERFTWNAEPAEWALTGSDTYFRVYEWADGVTLALQVMSDVMDRDTVERFLRGYARLLDESADESVDLTVGEAAKRMDFAPADARRLIQVGRDAVDADETEAVLCAHPAVRSARVSAADGGLVAEIAARGPVTAAELRMHVLGALDERLAVRCPSWFRISGADGAAAPVEADGLDADAAPGPFTEAERALATAVARVNDLEQVDLSICYSTAGGRVLRIPRVMAELRALGWDGLSAELLGGVRPLRALACLLSQLD